MTRDEKCAYTAQGEQLTCGNAACLGGRSVALKRMTWEMSSALACRGRIIGEERVLAFVCSAREREREGIVCSEECAREDGGCGLKSATC